MSKGNVLIVEDDKVSGTLLKKTLERLGYEVGAWVASIDEAKSAIQTNDFQLILSDYFLENGETGVQLVKTVNTNGHIPTIFITSSEDSRIVDDIISNGSYGYIHKPIWPQELRAVIELTLLKASQNKELQSMNEVLDKKVQERTQELDKAVKQLIREMSEKEKIHRKLQNALKTEKEFSELKSKIVANLSHEFKTPLSSIRSSAQLIKAIINKSEGDVRGIKHADKIEKGVDILTDILMRILTVEKEENMTYVRQLSSFDFDVFYSTLKEEFELEQGAKVKLIHEHSENVGLIRSDPNLIRLILTNLVSNACKYSPNGGEVVIKADVDLGSHKFYFKVIDQGIGMSKDDLKQVFFRFYRGHNVGSIEGTGIGMSIVNRALEALEGHIDIDSEVNKGTTMFISIPII